MKDYFICGTYYYDFTNERTIVCGAKNKLEAIKIFHQSFPKALIVSIFEINKEEKEWFVNNNMPNYKNIEYKEQL